MITINLLPEDLRENIIFSKKNRSLIRLLKVVIILCILLLVSIVICGVFLITSNQFFLKEIKESNAIIEDYKPIIDSAKKMEEKTKSIEKIKSSYKYWTKFNYILGIDTPPGAYLATLETQEDKLKLTGYAKTKNDVGLLRDTMEQSGSFENVNIDLVREVPDPLNPLANINTFSMNMKITKSATSKGAVK